MGRSLSGAGHSLSEAGFSKEKRVLWNVRASFRQERSRQNTRDRRSKNDDKKTGQTSLTAVNNEPRRSIENLPIKNNSTQVCFNMVVLTSEVNWENEETFLIQLIVWNRRRDARHDKR